MKQVRADGAAVVSVAVSIRCRRAGVGRETRTGRSKQAGGWVVGKSRKRWEAQELRARAKDGKASVALRTVIARGRK